MHDVQTHAGNDVVHLITAAHLRVTGGPRLSGARGEQRLAQVVVGYNKQAAVAQIVNQVNVGSRLAAYRTFRIGC